ncbi:GTP cyclohydrolase 1 feedback regulatory protein isoform X1 [Vombatus ursinus]|uniref:GTP cyclohydrolase 1 feedback regulatory protein isoform X1 n=1 Tax=Vombatus ursinus TaxID=29139 RepID=UPI000FFD4FBA|nr:GTP cyclohydrolase 1 feedback regulatory protein isoform X1 [Vombatus ursinus]
MPYLLISTQIRMEVGPTMVGDEFSDQELMEYLGATKRNVLGNLFWEYYVNDPPRIVLDKLEARGYRVACIHLERSLCTSCPILPSPCLGQPRSLSGWSDAVFLICHVSLASIYSLHSNPLQSVTEVPSC